MNRFSGFACKSYILLGLLSNLQNRIFLFITLLEGIKLDLKSS